VQTGLTDSTTYYYIVTAVNSAGESAASVQAAATTLVASTLPPAVPDVPASVTATGGAAQVTVSWSAVTGAASYNIYWSTTTGVTASTGTKITGTTSPYVHTGLSVGTAYYYVVTAVNSASVEGAASAQVSATTDTPPPPPACGTCHAIPPVNTTARPTAAGKHTFHVNSLGYSCSICHGTGYSATTVNAATHNNGTIDLVDSMLNWNATNRTCLPSCHSSSTRAW
jgi:hypothetical protein